MPSGKVKNVFIKVWEDSITGVITFHVHAGRGNHSIATSIFDYEDGVDSYEWLSGYWRVFIDPRYDAKIVKKNIEKRFGD